MSIDSNVLIPINEASQNFSKVARLVDESGMAVILKNNEPHYMVLNFKEYDEIQIMRRKFFNDITDSVINENIEALEELYKC